ncbi:MAG: hypothetical protein U0802_00325 [Candidatus Binatia bacterium]
MGRRLYVGNLAFQVTDADLQELFSQAGGCDTATVITDKFSGQSRGFGFVEMSSDSDAQQAISQFDGYELKGRAIKVNEAREREDAAAAASAAAGAAAVVAAAGAAATAAAVAARWWWWPWRRLRAALRSASRVRRSPIGGRGARASLPLQARVACICSAIRWVGHRTGVTILQHPRERCPLGTARASPAFGLERHGWNGARRGKMPSDSGTACHPVRRCCTSPAARASPTPRAEHPGIWWSSTGPGSWPRRSTTPTPGCGRCRT